MKLADIKDAVDFVSGDPMDMTEAWLCRETGKIHIVSEYMDGEGEEPLPEDLGSERYLAIPSKRELDLGKHLAIRFAYEHLPKDAERVEDIFRSRGAYGRFKSLLERRGKLDLWYGYEEEAIEAELRAWCELNDIVLDQA